MVYLASKSICFKKPHQTKSLIDGMGGKRKGDDGHLTYKDEHMLVEGAGKKSRSIIDDIVCPQAEAGVDQPCPAP